MDFKFDFKWYLLLMDVDADECIETRFDTYQMEIKLSKKLPNINKRVMTFPYLVMKESSSILRREAKGLTKI